ncbi:hypothetical protein LCGC14_2817160, partial [marine sediment metagenome]
MEGVGAPTKCSHAVDVFTDKGVVKGVLNYDDESETSELYVGNKSKSTVTIKRTISLGNVVQFASPMTKLSKTVYSGRSFDNKVGVVCVYETLKRLSLQEDIPSTIFGLVPSLEEISSAGAITAIQKIKPFIYINIDVFPATLEELGKGVAIEKGPFANNVLSDFLEKIAITNKIKHTIKILSGETETDMDKVMLQNGGIVVASLGIPLVNLHEPNEIIDISDLN